MTFRHPLVRPAAYRAASPPERRAAHQALAGATDPQADPDRRAWHRGQATPGSDDEVASELERSASRAQARGGLAATAAFLERSVALTLEPARRAERALAAAHARYQAGAFGAALELLATAEAGPLDKLASARAELLRQIAFARTTGSTSRTRAPSSARPANRSCWACQPFSHRRSTSGFQDDARDRAAGARGRPRLPYRTPP